ncbi:MAG TPA: hypothetical protein VGO67_18210 [Verrucomicrobiae bacterium]|jgi:hypothetical protein
MTPHTKFENCVVLLLLGFLVFVSIRALWYRRKVFTLLSSHTSDVPTLETINDNLASLNKESSKFMFTAERRANIPFRGHVVSFIYGHVGFLDGSKFGLMWRVNKQLYAISDLEQSEWMAKNADVFSPACMGSSCCVFWARVNNLKI